MYSSTLETPIGRLLISATNTEVTFIGFKDPDSDPCPNHLSAHAANQLDAYFAGTRLTFDFPITQPGTKFQQRVWTQLLEITAGNPISYTALAKRMDHLPAIRAIAAANGKNNVMIVVPCHRIIGANGDLVGYAGGLWRKQWLLQHEARITGLGQSLLF